MAMLDSDRWKRVQPLLDQALELPDEQRATWLDSLRSSAPELADDLDSLLADEAEADSTGFLTDPLEQLDARREARRS